MADLARVGAQAVTAIERQAWLDGLGDRLQRAIRGMFEAAGESGQRIADVLHGTWLGHPLHPVLTDVPLGAWTASLVLDVLDAREHRAGRYAPGADAALAVGVAGAVGAALTGLTDWHRTDGAARRTGLAHGLLNTAALALCVGSLALRRRGSGRPAARALAGFGFGIAVASAYLGGHLVYRRRLGVDHSPEIEGPDEFTDVGTIDDLREGQPRRAEVQGTGIVLVRRQGQVYALAERCSHLGGPLAVGQVEDATIVCPWHGSRFDLANGRVVNGPATADQPCYETRIRSGRIEVRRR